MTRDRIRKSCLCDSWAGFESLLRETDAGNDGQLGEGPRGRREGRRRGWERKCVFHPRARREDEDDGWRCSEAGFYFDFPEIVPRISAAGDRRFGKDGAAVPSFPPEVEARAVVEHQCLAKLVHTESLLGEAERLLVTGGASVNAEILQTLADVFGRKVFVQRSGGNSAALGSAFRANSGRRITLLPPSFPTRDPVL